LDIKNSISEETHHMPKSNNINFTDIKSIILDVPSIFNKLNNDLLIDLGSALDGKNAALAGGSVFDTIVTSEQPPGRDIDIFCTSEGFKQCYEKLKLVYNNMIVFTQHASCVTFIIPKQKKLNTNLISNDMIIQFIIIYDVIQSVTGAVGAIGFDFDHLKIVLCNGIVYMTYNALWCLRRGETRESADVKGCPMPHRLAKACRRIPIKKDPAVDEFSGQLINAHIARDMKYIYFDQNESDYRIDFMIRKVHSLLKKDAVYHIIGGNAIFIYLSTIRHSDSNDVIIDIIKKIDCSTIEPVNITTKSDAELLLPKVPGPEVHNNNNNIRPQSMFVANTTRCEYLQNIRNPLIKTEKYIGDRGLIPPVIIVYTKRNAIIVKPFKAGPIINNIFEAFEYLYIGVPDDHKYKIGNVIYCNVRNDSRQSTVVDLKGDDGDSSICKMVVALEIIKYADLENLIDIN
jgi:hypothetical protein